MSSSTSFDSFSLALSPAAGGLPEQPAPNWEEKHEALRAARAAREEVKSTLLREMLAGLRELAAGLDKDRWMFEQ